MLEYGSKWRLKTNKSRVVTIGQNYAQHGTEFQFVVFGPMDSKIYKVDTIRKHFEPIEGKENVTTRRSRKGEEEFTELVPID